MLSHLTGSVHIEPETIPHHAGPLSLQPDAALAYHDSPLGAMSVRVGCLTLPTRTSARM